MESKNSSRIAWIDIAKGIGIFLIVFGHTMKNGLVRQAVYSFHVPFFFFLAGVTYKREVFKTFLKKRTRGLLIPYWVWGLISIGIFLIMVPIFNVEEANTGILQNIYGLIYANPRTDLMLWNRPLWFIPCLFITLCLVNSFDKFITGGGTGAGLL